MKAYVIGLTTYKEIVRRPLFWLLAAIAAALLWLFCIIPYFTIGEDIKMVKDQGLTLLTVTGLVVALFAASVSIAEEIEGKTAITLLSKPINRRDFIVGKFGGIQASILLLFIILGIIFLACLWYKAGIEAKETAADPPTREDCHGRADASGLGAGVLSSDRALRAERGVLDALPDSLEYLRLCRHLSAWALSPANGGI